MVTVLEVPKTWKKIGEECYLDEKGIPHVITKPSYKSDEKARQRSLKRVRNNKEEARLRTAEWRKNNPEKKKKYNDKYSKAHQKCMTTAILIKNAIVPSYQKTKQKRIKKYVKEGRSKACAISNHKHCKRVRVSCNCDCHQ